MNIPKRFAGASDQLHEAAVAATGLSDFGSSDYLTGLQQILASFDEIERPDTTRATAWNTLLGALVGRLFAHKGWKEHPEALSRPAPVPLVITGVPRTGTTALHKLLSMDPQFQGLEMWLTSFPMPRPPRDTWQSNPLYQSVVTNLDAFYTALPHFKAIHLMVADEVDECLEVLKQTFCSNRYGSTFPMPSYDQWWLKQDELPSYQYLANVLRLIGLNDAGKPWLLKNPGHVWALDALFAVFPNACVVQTHRDPVKALPSLCSTLEAGSVLTGPFDPVQIGRRESALWSEAMRRTMAFRDRHDAARFIDVDHRDFHRDPMGAVRRIYDRFGFTLSEQAEQRMCARIADNPESSHGAHNYTLEHYGLTREAVREQFADYIRRHDL